MNLTRAVFIFCVFCLCLQIDRGQAASAHSVRGVVLTPDGTPVPDFTITVRRESQKPELHPRKRYKNGQFTIAQLTGDKYELRVSSPRYVTARLDFDFKSHPRSTEYSIVVLHPYRNEVRALKGAAETVSVTALQEKIPDEARNEYLKGVERHREGKLAEALMQYGKALRVYPDYLPALRDLGTIYILYNQPQSALTFLRRAQQIDEDNVVITLNIAIALTEQGDYAHAMKLFKKVLSRHPRLALAQYHVARVEYLQKK